MQENKRYTSVAISLHWLIAFFLIGLLAMGKYMTHLDETDPLRFTLTQWHKSFGITVFFLAVVRVLWRFTHRPPALPVNTPHFQSAASHATHLLMYLLMVVIPVSGWVFVSVSPLNLETVLYGVVPWPHISFLSSIPEKEALSVQAGQLHMWLANTLLLLILLHVCAALFHQLVQRDRLLSRMWVSDGHRDARDLNHGIVAGFLLIFAGGLFLYDSTNQAESVNEDVVSANDSGVSGAGESVTDSSSAASSANSNAVSGTASVPAQVGFTAIQSSAPLIGKFTEVSVDLFIDEANPERSTLSATVATASVSSGDSQLDGTMVTSGWFASDEFPEATFLSSTFEQIDNSSYRVTGDMTIKGTTREVEFVLLLEAGVGRGEFSIDRVDYGVGDQGQDEFVNPIVVIQFSVQNRAAR